MLHSDITSGIKNPDLALSGIVMKFFALLLSVCVSTGFSASTNKTDPNKDDGPKESWYDTQDYTYSVSLDVRVNLSTIKYCGGAQIGLEWVITAAECLHDPRWTAIVLTYANSMTNYKYHFFIKKVAKFVIHPDFDANTKSNNIALVKCHYCGSIRKTIAPTVPLAYQQTNPFSQSPAVVSAVLAITHANQIYGHYVKPVKTHVVSPFWCKVAHFFSIGERHICTSKLAGKLPKAEVGAPLVIQGHVLGRVQIVGIGTSISLWPSWIPVPMVFTRVEPYSDWIRNVTQIK